MKKKKLIKNKVIQNKRRIAKEKSEEQLKKEITNAKQNS